MAKVKAEMNKPVYSRFYILYVSKFEICEFGYNYIKEKYDGRAKLCYIDTNNFIIHFKTKDFLMISKLMQKRSFY